MGTISGFYNGLKTRASAVAESPSLYNIANWLTLGMTDTVKGAFAPEKPLSLEHWLDSLGVVSIAFGAYELAQSIAQPTSHAIQESPSLPDMEVSTLERPTWRQT